MPTQMTEHITHNLNNPREVFIVLLSLALLADTSAKADTPTATWKVYINSIFRILPDQISN